MDIQNKRILVTGASRGLGRTLVLALAAAGAREVFAGARKGEDIDSLKAEAAAAGLLITPIKLDVTSDDDVQAALRLGPIDILINNAGFASFGDPLQMSFADIRREI